MGKLLREGFCGSRLLVSGQGGVCEAEMLLQWEGLFSRKRGKEDGSTGLEISVFTLAISIFHPLDSVWMRIRRKRGFDFRWGSCTLLLHLHFPEQVKILNDVNVPGKYCFSVFLYKLANSGSNASVGDAFGLTEAQVSRMVCFCIDFLYSRYRHLLSLRENPPYAVCCRTPTCPRCWFQGRIIMKSINVPLLELTKYMTKTCVFVGNWSFPAPAMLFCMVRVFLPCYIILGLKFWLFFQYPCRRLWIQYLSPCHGSFFESWLLGKSKQEGVQWENGTMQNSGWMVFWHCGHSVSFSSDQNKQKNQE